MPRRRAQRWTGPLPPRVTSPPNNLEVFTPKNPPTARPPKISAPRESLLRPSRPPATSSAGQPLPLERASSGSSESAHAAQTLNGKDAGQTGRVRTRRRSRRRPYSPWLISHKVRNLAGDLCSRPVGRLSGADGDEAAEIAPNSTALSNLGASAGAYFIEPLPGGPSQACPPSPYPRRTANESRRAAPNAGQDPFRHASPHLPTTSRSSRRKFPQRHGLRKSRRLAKTTSGLLGPRPPRAPVNLYASSEPPLELRDRPWRQAVERDARPSDFGGPG